MFADYNRMTQIVEIILFLINNLLHKVWNYTF